MIYFNVYLSLIYFTGNNRLIKFTIKIISKLNVRNILIFSQIKMGVAQ